MAEHPVSYTDTDVEMVARTTYEDVEAETPGGWYIPWVKAEKRVRQEYERTARAVLSALAVAGRLLPVGHRYVNGDIVPEGSTE